MTPEAYREYMRDYMREYQRVKRDPVKHREYERKFQANTRAMERMMFCAKCEAKWERARYDRHPECPGCGMVF